jgi:hypothetical protein
MKPHIKAARRALQLYDLAVTAAEKFAAETPHLPGATIMRAVKHGFDHAYTCAECGMSCRDYETVSWKFCPGCGCEIIRFVRGEVETVIEPDVQVYKEEVVPEVVRVTYETAEREAKAETAVREPKAKRAYREKAK